MVYLLWKVVEYGVLLKIVVQFRQIFDGGERIAKVIIRIRSIQKNDV